MDSYELFISLRYLRARRKQVFVSIITFISIAGILLGVAALIIVLAVMNGFETDLRNKILGVNAHLVLMEYSGAMRNYEQVQDALEGVKGVVGVTPFIYGQGMVKSGASVSGVVIRGIDVESAGQVLQINRMYGGSMDDLSDRNRFALPVEAALKDLPGVVLGKELAKNLGLGLYDTVSIISPMGISTPMGLVPRIKGFLVVGIFDSGFYEYDASLIFLSLPDSQAFLNMSDLVTGIEIRLADIYEADRLAGVIKAKLGYPYWVRTWMEMNKNLFSALKLEKRVMAIILSLIVLVAAFNIITTLIMVVMEKHRDIAILKSMGASSQGIMKIFIFQGVTIGFIGTSLGCALGVTVALHLSRISLFIERLFGFKILPGDVYYLTELPSRVHYGDVALIALGTLLISLLSTIYPSWRASRLDPAETLRYE
ncbi:MAG: lipoprotein-releasing ABC transporter permease subunit [Deltaproteobacteria bacterium]|nr:lipoprotein-releasing ABC transporter permease subunit [Deltaproteobacteria bacterium]